jgi:hypothetical protein
MIWGDLGVNDSAVNDSAVPGNEGLVRAGSGSGAASTVAEWRGPKLGDTKVARTPLDCLTPLNSCKDDP